MNTPDTPTAPTPRFISAATKHTYLTNFNINGKRALASRLPNIDPSLIDHTITLNQKVDTLIEKYKIIIGCCDSYGGPELY